MAHSLPKLDNLLYLCFKQFPDGYWSEVYSRKKESKLSFDETCIFADIFQQASTRVGERQAMLTQFCTIPKDRACWDTVLAMYCVLEYDKGRKSEPLDVRSVASRLLQQIHNASDRSEVLNWKNTLSFGEDSSIIDHLVEVSHSRVENLFLSDPIETIRRLLVLNCDMSEGPSEEEKKKFVTESMENIKEVLNQKEWKEQYQKEVELLSGLEQ